MTNPSPDYIELNNQIDTMLSSEDALQAALNSDNPLLQAAARLTNNIHPLLPVAIKQAILSDINSLSGNPASTSSILRPDFTAWMARIAAIFLITIVAGLLAKPASAESLPGDILYPVKLTFEQLELRLAGTSEAEIAVRLNHAEERLHELEQLLPDSELFGTTLQSAMENVQSASTIAWENAVFEADIVLLEQAESVVINIERHLNTVTVPREVLASIQLSLDVVRVQLPAPAIVEITPETTETITEETLPESTETITEEASPESTETTVEATLETIENTTSVDTSDYIAVTPFTMYVHADGQVNMREGAGTGFDVSATANQNSPVTILGQNTSGDWYFVRLSNGTEGWVFVDFLDDTPGDSSNSSGNGNGNNSGNGNGNSNNSGNGNGNGNSSGRGN